MTAWLLNESQQFQGKLGLMEPSFKSTFLNRELTQWFHKVPWCLTGAIQNSYDLQRTLIQEEERFSVVERPALFSIITALYNTPEQYLKELIWSLQIQSWQKWQLILIDDGSSQCQHFQLAERAAQSDQRIVFVKCEKNTGISGGRNAAYQYVKGDFIAILDHDDLLHPQTLGIYARYLVQNPKVNFIFSNELKITDDSTKVSDFFVKPEFDFSTLLRTNYICHFTAVARTLCQQLLHLKGALFNSEYDGCEDHEYFLHLSQLPGFHSAHLPLFTYYWRKAATSTSTSIETKPYVYERGKAMIMDFYQRALYNRGVELKKVESLPEKKCGSFYSLDFVPSKIVKILAIIPFRDSCEMTKKAILSLAQQNLEYLDLHIVAVNNRSSSQSGEEMLTFKKNWSLSAHFSIENFDEPFNYNRLHNKIIEKCKEVDTEHILFMNNDVEFVKKSTLGRMASELILNSNVAACGIRLLYADGQDIQHGGIKFCPPQLGLGYYWTTHIGGRPEEFAFDEHCCSGVTFACTLINRKIFDMLGGLDEVYCPNGYGDTDFCLKLQKARYAVFYLGSETAIHHETKTRPHVNEDAEIFFLNHKNENLQNTYLHRMHYEMSPSSFFNSSDQGYVELPLRYKVIDKINEKMKRYAKPLHRLVKLRLK